MKNKKKIAGIISTLAMMPFLAFAQGPGVSTKIHLDSWVGTVSGTVSGSTFTLNTNGTIYTVDASTAKAHRRFGALMQLTDIQPGDSVVVRGVANGTTISAKLIQDTSLQARNGVFSGKVTIAPDGTGFTLQSVSRGSQKVNYDSTTIFKKNGQAASSADVVLGSQVRVTGVWDSTNSNITAKFVNVVVRMAKVNITGSLSSVSGNSLSVVGSNNTNYTVDASQAKITSKSGGKLTAADLIAGDSLKIRGSHEVSSVNVKAGVIRDMSR